MKSIIEIFDVVVVVVVVLLFLGIDYYEPQGS
jgi:hypothetical protein